MPDDDDLNRPVEVGRPTVAALAVAITVAVVLGVVVGVVLAFW